MSAESLAFKDWLKVEGLVHTGNVKQIFDDTIIGFEAEDYLNSILTNSTTREPLLPALGGSPFALQHHVDSDLDRLEAAGIKPYFVFNGLDTACRDRKSVLNESLKASKTLHDAWTVYDQGRGDDAVVAFGKACQFSCLYRIRCVADVKQAHTTHLTYYDGCFIISTRGACP